MNFHQFLIPRLDGKEILTNFEYYLNLVRNGIAGFIIFGGEVEALREGIIRLQNEASLPLIIASDLEQGLGQQVKGGTIFPPAMGVAAAETRSPGLARKAFECIAREASYVGINTIFAPVLDVDTNQNNPIIATRAFSDDPTIVSRMGRLMTEVFMQNGIIPCGKHFPGHGSTGVDSHLTLPTVEMSMGELEACELIPFRDMIALGIPMLMLGHLSVPAIDPSSKPISVSKKALGFLRTNLGFAGITVTDAMDMGGLVDYSAEEASLMALEAGVDLLLHPAKPEELANKLSESDRSFDSSRIEALRTALSKSRISGSPPPLCKSISDEITVSSIIALGELTPLKDPFVLVLSDEGDDNLPFVDAMKEHFPHIEYSCVLSPTDDIVKLVPPGKDLIIAIYSGIRAFKGGTSSWIKDAIRVLDYRTKAAVSFGNPHILDNVCSDTYKVLAWWDHPEAQLAAVKTLLN